MQLTVISNGYQLSFFRIKSKNEFILEIFKVEHLQKKRSSRGKKNYLT